MVRLWLLRHAPTAWSAEKRLQGRHDAGLSPAGRTAAANWRLPRAAAGCVWYTSPLGRCSETAGLLGLQQVRVEPSLIEMDWGAWEGRTASELKVCAPDELRREEARGLDMQPPGGESPRTMLARLGPWLRARAVESSDVGAVTHKGVIRAIYAASRGWDMTGQPPDDLRWDCIHAFTLAPTGEARVAELNIALAGTS